MSGFIVVCSLVHVADAHAGWPKWLRLRGDKQGKTAPAAATSTQTPPPPRTTPARTTLRTAPVEVRREAPPPKPVITRAQVDRTVGDARAARWTTGFDAAHQKAVTEIKELYAAGNVSAAQDAAAQALHSYMDHHNLHIGNFPSSQVFFARTYATQAGLNGVLNW
jgi:hypothetical protein